MVPCSPAPRSLASPASQPAMPAGPASRAALWLGAIAASRPSYSILVPCVRLGFIMSCRALSGSSGRSQGQGAFHPAVALIGGKQKAVHQRAISRYLDVVEVSQPTLLAACGPPKVWGAGPIRRVGGGVCVVGWAGVPKFLRAPRHLGRVLASSCDTGMYFHALFPTYRYIACANALQRSHYLTLPRYTHLTYSCPPRPFSPATRFGERRSAGAKKVSRSTRARRPGVGIRSASPLSAASKPALHPAPAFFLRTTTIPLLRAGASPTLAKLHRP